MNTSVRARHAERGFSMVELLVTVVLAGIIFAAMGPLIVNALDRTSEDEVRVDGNAIAQDRLEQVRLLGYTDITEQNLNYSPSPTASPFGDGLFGPTYQLFDESRAYNVHYYVTPTPQPTSLQKFVKVSVSRPGSTYVTTAQTIVRDSRAGINSVTDTEPSNLTLTVYFDKPEYVIPPGITLQRVQKTTNETVWWTADPATAIPPITGDPKTEVVKFTGLIGGPNYTYSVFCWTSKPSVRNMAAPPFRLWTSGKIKFDTYPGGD